MARILIADDDLVTRMELCEMLDSAGHDLVGEAETGQQAIEMAQDFHPDLIVMDIVMPGGMDGITAAEKIKKASDTAIVFISGYGDPEYIERAKRLEPFGYVMKPFDEREVKAFIEIALHKRAMELKLRHANKLLKKSEEKYRLLFEMSNEGICLHEMIYDPTGNAVDYKILDVNSAYENITGMAKREVVGRKASEVYGIGIPPFLETYAAVAESGKPTNFEEYWPPMEKFFRISAFSPEKGKFATVFTDLTDRKVMERALRETEKKFFTVFHASPVCITFTTLEDGRIVEMNDACSQVMGYERSEALGKTTLEIGPWPEPEKRTKYIDQIKEKGGFNNKEIKFKKKNKETFLGLWSVRRIEMGSEEYLVNVLVDITERKHAEEELLESQKRFKDFAEMLPEVVFETDKNLKLTFVNKKTYEITGYAEQDFINGLSGFDMLAPGERKRAKENLTKRLQGERIKTVEYVGLRKDGSTYPMLLNTSPIKKGDTVIGFRGVIMDITDIKKTEEHLKQAQQMEARGVGNILER
ncbi:MAG: PAS domain S-box protein [Deltaproteobacteria bacterium]|nr:PAS domain S-box protein [Deltaproteobacteria bacterium]